MVFMNLNFRDAGLKSGNLHPSDEIYLNKDETYTTNFHNNIFNW